MAGLAACGSVRRTFWAPRPPPCSSSPAIRPGDPHVPVCSAFPPVNQIPDPAPPLDPARTPAMPPKSPGPDEPPPPQPARYREVTVSAVVFAVLFGGLMNMAITYTGLKLGFTIV